MGEVRVRSVEEAELHVLSLTVRVQQLEHEVRDHAQRLDTAQSHQWKRLWFFFWGWPLTDWNAQRPDWRPWNRKRKVR